MSNDNKETPEELRTRIIVGIITGVSKYFHLENTTTCGGGSDCQGQALATYCGVIA